MSKLTTQLEELLSNEALNHSLSKEALERMLNEITALTAKLDTAQKMLTRAECREDQHSKDLKKQARLLQQWEERYSELAEREKAVENRELIHMRSTMALDYEKVRVADHKETLQLLLRNRVVSEQILSTGPTVLPGIPGSQDQYGNQLPGSPSVTVTEDTKSEINREEK